MVSFDKSFDFGAQSSQYIQELNPAKADSTQVVKQKSVSTAKPNSIHTVSKSKQPAQTTQTQQPKTPETAKKPVPKPPVPQEITIKSSNSTNDAGITVGTFNTNVPTFKDLNIQNKTATAVANGVGIYGGNADDYSISDIPDSDPPQTQIKFKNKGITVTFDTPPEGTSIQQSIVCNPDTGVYVFNNLEGLRLSAAHTGPNQQNKGGESFMINGGSLDFLDSAERMTNNEKDSEYNVLNKGVIAQNFILKDVTVKNGAITMGNDNLLAIGSTQMDTTQIKTLYRTGESGINKQTNVAYEGHNNEESRTGLQTGFAVSSGLKQWFGGTEKDMKLIKTGEEKGSLKVQSKQFSSLNMKDVTVARTHGNVNIYTSNEQGADIGIYDNKDGTVTYVFNAIDTKDGGKNIRLTLDANQPKDAKIFYDKDTGTIYCEKLVGVRQNPPAQHSSWQEYNQGHGHYYMHDCDIDYANLAEYVDKIGKAFINTEEEGARDTLVLENCRVRTLVSSYDDIFMDDNSSVQNYVGFRDNAPIDLQKQNQTFDAKSSDAGYRAFSRARKSIEG